MADENPRSGVALKFDPNKNLGPLVLALAIALGPHVFRLPIWVVLWCVICWCYLLAAARYNLVRPGKVMRLALTMGGIFLVMLNSGGSLDRFSSVALLWIMASIKPMEIRSYRDEMVTVFMVYFLAVSGLFFSSSLAAGLSVAVSIGTTTAVLIHLHHPNSGPGANLRLSAKLFLKALPLALILFIFFPRIQGSIWGFRNETFATSGFSDRLAPGDVTGLVRDNAIAFRAKFESRIPEPEQLYWRGLVFLRFDGRAWHLNDHAIPIAQPINGNDSRDYTITLEPHNHHWLFALDLPYFSDANTIILSDQTLISRWKVKRRIQYRLKSYTSYATGPLRGWESAALKIPYNQNPEAVELARKWRVTSESPTQFIETALKYFRNNDFQYTLNPPPLGNASIDDFLFRTRKGYCEHYASAFTYLMRAAGIPARLVAGYQGGDRNPFGEYLIIRQSDAHVWVEVWLPGKGWTRIDPTLAVAPNRVAQGPAASLPPEERTTLDAFSAWGPFAGFLTHLRFGWDSVSNQWNRWVPGYSTARQKFLLAKIGLKKGTAGELAAAGIPAVAAVILIVLFYFIINSNKDVSKPDAVQKAYLIFGAKLERRGLARRLSQGPLDYASMVAALRPDLQIQVFEIADLYSQLRYGQGGDRNDLKRLKTMVKRFNP